MIHGYHVEERLKPCGVCGGDPSAKLSEHGCMKRVTIKCNDCGLSRTQTANASGYREIALDSIESWNTMPTDTTISEE